MFENIKSWAIHQYNTHTHTHTTYTRTHSYWLHKLKMSLLGEPVNSHRKTTDKHTQIPKNSHMHSPTNTTFSFSQTDSFTITYPSCHKCERWLIKTLETPSHTSPVVSLPLFLINGQGSSLLWRILSEKKRAREEKEVKLVSCQTREDEEKG